MTVDFGEKLHNPLYNYQLVGWDAIPASALINKLMTRLYQVVPSSLQEEHLQSKIKLYSNIRESWDCIPAYELQRLDGSLSRRTG